MTFLIFSGVFCGCFFVCCFCLFFVTPLARQQKRIALGQQSSSNLLTGCFQDATTCNSNGFITISSVVVSRTVFSTSNRTAWKARRRLYCLQPLGQHKITQFRRFIEELTAVQWSLILTRQQRCFFMLGTCPQRQRRTHRKKNMQKGPLLVHHKLLCWGKEGPHQFVTVKEGHLDKQRVG